MMSDFQFDFRAYLTKSHDGDSFWVLADSGFGQRYEPELRLLDVPAPELSQVGGMECTDHINAWLLEATTSQPKRRWPLYIISVLTKIYEPNQKMTFTRYLATVWRFDDRPIGPTPGPSLNEYMREYLAEHPDWPSGM